MRGRTSTVSLALPTGRLMAERARVVTLYGKTLADMDRDELLGVIDFLSARYLESVTPEKIHERALGRVEMLKRGEV